MEGKSLLVMQYLCQIHAGFRISQPKAGVSENCRECRQGDEVRFVDKLQLPLIKWVIADVQPRA